MKVPLKHWKPGVSTIKIRTGHRAYPGFYLFESEMDKHDAWPRAKGELNQRRNCFVHGEVNESEEGKDN